MLHQGGNSMNLLILLSAVILGIIAVTEIMLIFFSLPRGNTPAYLAILPVFSEDSEFDERLDHIAQKGCGRRNIILVNYTANPHQIELCNRFVHNNPDAVFIKHEEIENFFAKTFAIPPKM